MLTPTSRDKPCVSVVNEPNPVAHKQSAQFQCWNITELPAELLLQITRHLSLEDKWNLALASRRVYSVLEDFGELEVVSYYYSLPGNRQLFYRDLSIANPQLIHHLRSSKIKAIARQTHCPENLPAVCAYHAYHLHNETVNATSIHFELKEAIRGEVDLIDYYLNRNHSRLIAKDLQSQVSIWSAGHDGSWNKECTTEENSNFQCHDNIDRYHGNTVFMPLKPNHPERCCYREYCGNDNLLSIIERDESGVWFETQRMTFDELFPLFGGKRNSNFDSFSLKTSPDGKSLIYATDAARSVILGRELNGRWAIKGNCPRGYSVDFSPDSNHIVINRARCVKFFGKQEDGSWSATGTLNLTMDTTALMMAGIEEDDLRCFNNLSFSPDSRHFVACFNDSGVDFVKRAIDLEDFFVIVASFDDNGQWSETTRIIKHNPAPISYALLDATFSPDSSYLVVCGENNFDIWHLTDDNSWAPVIKNHDYLQQFKNYTPRSRVQFNADSSVFLLLRKGLAMVWQLDGSGKWNRCHCFDHLDSGDCRSNENSILLSYPQLSADGHSIIYTDGYGRLHIQVQDQYGKWTRQALKTDIRIFQVAFNQEGDLLAGIAIKDKSRLIVLGMTPTGTWKEKGCLPFRVPISSFDFSHCGHSIMVALISGQQDKFLTFWKIKRECEKNIQ